MITDTPILSLAERLTGMSKAQLEEADFLIPLCVKGLPLCPYYGRQELEERKRMFLGSTRWSWLRFKLQFRVYEWKKRIFG